jgi:hypothetical protein
MEGAGFMQNRKRDINRRRIYPDKKGEFINIPTKQEMLKTVEIKISKLPFLVYGDRKDLEAKDIKPVTI